MTSRLESKESKDPELSPITSITPIMQKIINKHDKEDLKIINKGIEYNFHIVPNVTSFVSEYTKWIIDYNSVVIDKEVPVFLILDNVNGDAFGHWVYESAIYLPIFSQLKEKFPNLKIYLSSKKRFKSLFVEYFHINDSDICYEFSSENLCIFYDPVTSLNDHEITETYIKQADYFIGHFVDHFSTASSSPGRIREKLLLMPRQKLENFKGNDRTYDTENLEKEVLATGGSVLHTDDVLVLKDQINTVSDSKNIILTDGSPLLVNGMFASESNIFVIGDVTPGQIYNYPKMYYIIRRIVDKGNQIHYTDNPKTGNRLGGYSLKEVLSLHRFVVTVDTIQKLFEIA
jgi:hypothetical protein